MKQSNILFVGCYTAFVFSWARIWTKNMYCKFELLGWVVDFL